jgi:hypothetical protein
MLFHKADAALTVQVPDPAADRPPWKKVAVIATLGFLVGVAWPRLTGVRLGPSLPEASPGSTPVSAPATQAPPAAVAASVAPSSPAPGAFSAVIPALMASPAPPAPAPPSPPSLNVSSGTVSSCKTSTGDSLKGSECGRLPGLDGIVMPRLRKLAECPDAAEATGRLQLLLHIDFPRGLLSVDLGRGQSVTSPDALLACAKADLAGTNTAGVAHDNPRYTVAYAMAFGGGVHAAAPAASPSTRPMSDSTEGAAQVIWEVALVRDAPKTGKVVARLQRGATLHIGPSKDGWYPVKYGDGFASDGWVYRGAIGR